MFNIMRKYKENKRKILLNVKLQLRRKFQVLTKTT